ARSAPTGPSSLDRKGLVGGGFEDLIGSRRTFVLLQDEIPEQRARHRAGGCEQLLTGPRGTRAVAAERELREELPADQHLLRIDHARRRARRARATRGCRRARRLRDQRKPGVVGALRLCKLEVSRREVIHHERIARRDDYIGALKPFRG